MAKVEIQYNADEEIQQIIDKCKEYIDMSNQGSDTQKFIQDKLQLAFLEGRKFQKQNPNVSM